MSVHVRAEQRRLLPRWRESSVASTTAEVIPISPATGTIVVSKRAVEERLKEWEDAPSVGTAADAVASGFVLDASALVARPAEYLLSSTEQVPAAALSIARRVLGVADESEIAFGSRGGLTSSRMNRHRTAVALLRARLISTPRDPLSYLDLARRYAALGQLEQCSRALRSALALAPSSRFVLRSAARFFVHTRNPERAQDLLRRSPRTSTDPWLMAAEISSATVANRPSRLIRPARDLILRGGVAPIHLSELAGSLGTLELLNGNVKAARKLFAQSMQAPTDNSLAQAQWALPKLGIIDLPNVNTVPRSFEADALNAAREGEWARALEACFDWLDDEPFSHKSATLGSFVASTGLDDHVAAVSFAREGLTANPSDHLLRNNLVFALASGGQLVEAMTEAKFLDSTALDADSLIAWTATVGFINYRAGNLPLGREHYASSVSKATQQGRPTLAAIAALYWALSSHEAGEDGSMLIREMALERAMTISDPAVTTLRQRLLATGAERSSPAR